MTCKSIAENYHERVWNEKNLGAIDDCLDENIVIHSTLGDYRGKDEMRTIVETWLKAFPDVHVRNQSVICENDLAVIQWTAKGTHRGEFKGKKPTGKSVSYGGVTVYQVKNNKITEYWAYLDMQHLLAQLENRMLK